MSSRTRDIIAWVLLIGVVVFSVVRTQSTNEQLAKQGSQVSDLVYQMAKQQQCTESFLSATVEAANERTTLTPLVNQADRDRITAQGRLIGFLVAANRDPSIITREPKAYTKVLNEYFNKLQDYLRILSHQDKAQKLNPYPTKDDYRSCLNSGEKKKGE